MKAKVKRLGSKAKAKAKRLGSKAKAMRLEMKTKGWRAFFFPTCLGGLSGGDEAISIEGHGNVDGVNSRISHLDIFSWTCQLSSVESVVLT